METAKSITSDIRWLLQDRNLDRNPDFKVQTKRHGEVFVTVVIGVGATVGAAALAEYASNTPGVELSQREYDGNLTVTQPAGSR